MRYFGSKEKLFGGTAIRLRLQDLKRILQRELQNPRGNVALYYTERIRMQIRYRRVEVHMIENVEKFKTQLEPLALADLEKPGQVAVNVEEARSFQRIVTRVPIRASGVGGECRGIYPNERTRI